MMSDADKAMQKSVIEGVEKAGGFVIDRPNTPSAHDRTIEKPISKEAVQKAVEEDTAITAPDHLLGDVPDPMQKATVAPKKPDQFSIVDTLLAKGVAIPMDSGASKSGSALKTEPKVRPYDGTDPYREAIK